MFTLQTLPACDEPFDDGVGKAAGFSLHAGVAARADERQKLEQAPPPETVPESAAETMLRLTGIDIARCPHCHLGKLSIVALLLPQTRGPPRATGPPR